MACSNTVYITSYYNGVAYYYVMVKSGNAITTNLLMEKPTTEKNGVEITIKNIDLLTKYKSALNYIIFFPNIFIDGDGYEINSTKLKYFTNFAAANVRVDSKLLLGNVLYPCNSSLLSQESGDFLQKIYNSGIVVRFKVGELNITPNRESIIYTTDTIKKIESRIKDAKEELEKLASAKLIKDYDDISDYCDAIKDIHWYDPITDSISENHFYTGYPITLSEVNTNLITYKGKKLHEDVRDISVVLSVEPPNFKGAFIGDTLYVKNLPYRENYNNMKSSRIVILNTGTRMVDAVRKFMKENWQKNTIVSDFTLEDFKKSIEDSKIDLKSQNKDIIIEEVYKCFKKRASTVDLEKNQEFLDIKASLSTKGKRIAEAQEVILRVYRSGHCYPDIRTFKNFYNAVAYLKSLKTGVILGDMKCPESIFSSFAAWKNFVFVKARKSVVAELKDMGLKCIVDPDWVTQEDPILAKVSAIVKEFGPTMDRDRILKIAKTVPKDLADSFIKITNLFLSINYDVKVVARKHEPDPYTMKICKILKDYIDKYTKAENLLLSNELMTNSQLVNAIIIKTKSYRVNWETYLEFKNNKIIKLLCRK